MIDQGKAGRTTERFPWEMPVWWLEQHWYGTPSKKESKLNLN